MAIHEIYILHNIGPTPVNFMIVWLFYYYPVYCLKYLLRLKYVMLHVDHKCPLRAFFLLIFHQFWMYIYNYS